MSELNDDPYKTAAIIGADVVEPGENELFVDIDDDADLVVMGAQMMVLDNIGVATEIVKTTTSPGGNKHAYVKVKIPSDRTLSPTERVALQACLGSDRKRELLSLFRIVFGLDRPPTVFFERRR